MKAYCIFYGHKYSYNNVVDLQREFNKCGVNLKCDYIKDFSVIIWGLSCTLHFYLITSLASLQKLCVNALCNWWYCIQWKIEPFYHTRYCGKFGV